MKKDHASNDQSINWNNQPTGKKYVLMTKPDISNLSDSKHIIFPISVGEPYHSGQSLKTLLKYVKANCPDATILVADTLHRFNYLGLNNETTMEDAREKAIKEGDDFVDQYAEELEGLNLIRWEQWKEKYSNEYKKSVNLIEKNIVLFKKLKKLFRDLTIV